MKGNVVICTQSRKTTTIIKTKPKRYIIGTKIDEKECNPAVKLAHARLTIRPPTELQRKHLDLFQPSDFLSDQGVSQVCRDQHLGIKGNRDRLYSLNLLRYTGSCYYIR
jgi:hypothetical protein